MSREFHIFISSTIDDLKNVRKKLSRALATPGRVVRCSEDFDFPAHPKMSSHDACLEVIARSHAFVLLINTRYGGEYARQNKSITWREWESAMEFGLSPIVLINRKTSDLCKEILEERRKLQKSHPSWSPRKLDDALEKLPKLRQRMQGYHHAPSLQRFVDTLRKGHIDNWRLDWNGTPQQAIDYVQHNLAVQAATAEDLQSLARNEAQDAGRTIKELATATEIASDLLARLRTKAISADDAIELFLNYIASERKSLFGFRTGDDHARFSARTSDGREDHYTLVVHERKGDKLYPVARAAHGSLPAAGRVWRIDQSHVGYSVQHDEFMVSGDIRHSDTWVHDPQSGQDDQHYVSVVAKPLYRQDGTPGGCLTLTSNRVDHFTDLDDPEIQAFNSVASLVNMLVVHKRSWSKS